MSGIFGIFGGDQLRRLSSEKDRLNAEIRRLESIATASSQAAGVRSVSPLTQTEKLKKAQKKLDVIQTKWQVEAAKRYSVLGNMSILAKFAESEPAFKAVQEYIEKEVLRFSLAEQKKGVTIRSPNVDLAAQVELKDALKPVLDRLFYQLILGENLNDTSKEVQALFALTSYFGFPGNLVDKKEMFSTAKAKGYITEDSDSYKIFLCVQKLSEYVPQHHMTDGFSKEMTEFHGFGTQMLEALNELQIKANGKDFCRPEEKEAKNAAYLAARDELDKIYLSFNPLLQALEKEGIEVKFEAHRGVTRYIADHEKERNAIKQVHSQGDLNTKVKVAFYFAVISANDESMKFWREVGENKLGISSTEFEQILRTPGKFAQEQNIPLSNKSEYEILHKIDFEKNYREQQVIATEGGTLPVQQEKLALFKEVFIAKESGNQARFGNARDMLQDFAQRIVDDNPLAIFIGENLKRISKAWEKEFAKATERAGLHFSFAGNAPDKLQDFKKLYDQYRNAAFRAALEPDGKNNDQLHTLEERILDQAKLIGDSLKLKLRGERSSVHEILFDNIADKVQDARNLRSEQKGFSRGSPSNSMNG